MDNKQLIKELTLVLMYLTAYEQDGNSDSALDVLGISRDQAPSELADEKVQLTYNLYEPKILEELGQEGYIKQRFGCIKTILNESGVEKAKEFIEKYKL